ncbi:hypothetical protein [Fodinicola acaciae]|uniref:hypothetical protein n=1 Tax=Fodinicola acaciae TaxID=2681555 RepID=UPI0013D2AC44|nr:hypothetical protein [Fodinicola acaciae]
MFLATSMGNPATASPVTVDGYAVGYLPHGISRPPSAFAYEWENVVFHSLVWESGDDEHGWKVDMSVAILRGSRLTSPAALNAFWTKYTAGDAEPWRPVPVRVHGKPGFRSGSRIVWLDQAGIAPTVSIDISRFSADELMPTAQGIRQLSD